MGIALESLQQVFIVGIQKQQMRMYMEPYVADNLPLQLYYPLSIGLNLSIYSAFDLQSKDRISVRFLPTQLNDIIEIKR